MRKAYIILAHKNPAQVSRLIERLDDKRSSFFLHVDKKCGDEMLKDIQIRNAEVNKVKRAVANWGEYGLVQAVLNSLQAIRDTGIYFDYIILLSGQDYPIKPNKAIDRFLQASSYSIFLEHFSLPNDKKWQPSGGMYRVNKYFFGFKWYQRYLAKVVNGIGIILPALRRRIPSDMKPYSGSIWWIIDQYTMFYILDFVNKNPGYVRYHRSTFAADEVFFHMLLLNTEDEKIRKGISNTNLHHIRWKDIKSSHPEIMLTEHFHELKRSSAMFARKFDVTVDTDILDLIDKYCLSEHIQVVEETV
jgi:hypothetical protein